MKSLQFSALALGAGLLFTGAPAFCQGMMEMGGVYGGAPRGSMGGLGDAVKGLYGRGAAVPQPSGSSRAPRLSQEDASQYATQANRSYTLATQAAKAGKKDIALKEHASAVPIRARMWGVGDPAIAEISRKQAEIYKQQGKLADVETCYRRVLAADTHRWGQGAPQLTKTVETLASLCDQQGKNKEALSFYRLLYGLKTKEGGLNSPGTKTVRIKLATLMTFTADFNGAEQLLKEGVATEEALPAHDNAYLGQLYDTYGALMREAGRPAEAALMEEKAKSAKDPAAAKPAAAPSSSTDSPPTAAPPAAAPTSTNIPAAAAQPGTVEQPAPGPTVPAEAKPAANASPSMESQPKPAATSP